MLSAETTVNSCWSKLGSVLPVRFDWTLCWMKRERVSEDAHTPNRFSILSRREEPPRLSTMSTISVCSGTEHLSSVQNRRVHRANSCLIFFTLDTGEAVFFEADFPLLSETDLVSMLTAFHSLGSICSIRWSISTASC